MCRLPDHTQFPIVWLLHLCLNAIACRLNENLAHNLKLAQIVLFSFIRCVHSSSSAAAAATMWMLMVKSCVVDFRFILLANYLVYSIMFVHVSICVPLVRCLWLNVSSFSPVWHFLTEFAVWCVSRAPRNVSKQVHNNAKARGVMLAIVMRKKAKVYTSMCTWCSYHHHHHYYYVLLSMMCRHVYTFCTHHR